MRRGVREGFDAAARSLSFGLVYVPGRFAETEELVALAEEAARVGAPLVSHTRNEADGILGAVGEMIDVARRSGAPLHLSHLKAMGDGRNVAPLLALIDEARRDHDVTFDQYPYFAGSTTLASLLPGWAQEGGAEATLARLADTDARRRIVGGTPPPACPAGRTSTRSAARSASGWPRPPRRGPTRRAARWPSSARRRA